jgi:hypothetical protein
MRYYARANMVTRSFVPLGLVAASSNYPEILGFSQILLFVVYFQDMT